MVDGHDDGAGVRRAVAVPNREGRLEDSGIEGRENGGECVGRQIVVPTGAEHNPLLAHNGHIVEGIALKRHIVSHGPHQWTVGADGDRGPNHGMHHGCTLHRADLVARDKLDLELAHAVRRERRGDPIGEQLIRRPVGARNYAPLGVRRHAAEAPGEGHRLPDCCRMLRLAADYRQLLDPRAGVTG